MMKCLLYMAFGLLFFGVESLAKAPPTQWRATPDWTNCTRLKVDKARLACFDSVARTATRDGEAPNYEAEIEQYAINKCLLTQIREAGLDKTLGEDRALRLMKLIQKQALTESRDAIRGMVVGRSREVRIELYAAAFEACMHGARSAR